MLVETSRETSPVLQKLLGCQKTTYFLHPETRQHASGAPESNRPKNATAMLANGPMKLFQCLRNNKADVHREVWISCRPMALAKSKRLLATERRGAWEQVGRNWPLIDELTFR